MSELYTDDDLETIRKARRAWLNDESDDRPWAHAILDAVAPAIAARALREAAEALAHNEKTCNVQRTCHLADTITLRERADEIERT